MQFLIFDFKFSLSRRSAGIKPLIGTARLRAIRCVFHFRPLSQTVRSVATIFVVLPAVALGKQSQYFRLGNPVDVQSPVHGGLALVGGGADLDQAFTWMCVRSGGGDFLVLRATGDDSYNRYVKDLCQLNSVATLIISDRESAREPRVAEIMRQAEAVFIAGGDQANYINAWTGTPVQQAINDAIRRGVTIGGTSAGLAVLGEFVYSAQNDAPDGSNLTSAHALVNPYDQQVTIVRGFLTNPLLTGVITDTHFTARDRLGRLLVFMARILQDQAVDRVRAIGVDERTAVLTDTSGQAEVVGSGSAYFLRAAHKPETCRAGAPLTFRGVEARRLRTGERFDVASWISKDGTPGSISVEAGRVRAHWTLQSSQ